MKTQHICNESRKHLKRPSFLRHECAVRWILFAVLVGGCTTTNPTASFLGQACTSNSQCGGNPCYHAQNDSADASFCGAPCGSCPSGYSCQTVAPLSGPM